MKPNGCPGHQDLVRLARADAIDAQLQHHVDGCAECGQVVRIAAALAPLAADAGQPPSLTVTLWRARAESILRTTGARRKRVARPLRAFHVLSGSGFFLAALLVGIGTAVQPDLSGTFGGAGVLLAGAMAAAGSYQISRAEA